jgi:hypothetical protein
VSHLEKAKIVQKNYGFSKEVLLSGRRVNFLDFSPYLLIFNISLNKMMPETRRSSSSRKKDQKWFGNFL